MAERLNCVVQAGHVPRTRGATGSQGVLGSEQAFTLKTATHIQKWLTLRGWTCEQIGADDDIPDSTLFVAIHHDGSSNSKARGPSVGYPIDAPDASGTPASKAAAQVWKRVYGKAYPGPTFRPDNYTRGLRGYYAFRKSTARIKLCLEHGFGTNPEDARFMWSDAGQDAAVDAVEAVLGHWLGWDAKLSPAEVHARLNPGAPPLTEAQETPVEAPSEPDDLPEAQTPPPAPPAPSQPFPGAAEPQGRQSPEAELPPPVIEEMPVTDIKERAGHTAWQSAVGATVFQWLRDADIDPEHVISEPELIGAITFLSTLFSVVKTWWQNRGVGAGRHTS